MAFSEPDHDLVLPNDFTVSIFDDEESISVRIQVSPDVVREDQSSFRLTAIRSGSIQNPLKFKVRYVVGGNPEGQVDPGQLAVPGTDFEAVEGIFEFGPGMTEQSVEVRLLNDAELDGTRLLPLSLIPMDGTLAISGDQQILALQDDERDQIQQQVILEPYLPTRLDGEETQEHWPLPDGGTLVRRSNRLLRLGRNGLPDRAFGHGTGQVQLDTGSAQDGPWSLLLISGGRIQLSNQERIFRLTGAGLPDHTFGNGTGYLSMPGGLLATSSSGEMLFAVYNDGRMRLIRVLPDGSIDSAFSAGAAGVVYSSVESAGFVPGGGFWVMADKGQGLALLRFAIRWVPRTRNPGVPRSSRPCLWFRFKSAHGFTGPTLRFSQ